MHVLLAPDKFKGSLTAREVAAHLATGLRRAVPGLAVRQVPVADGGGGTLDAGLVQALGARLLDAAGAELPPGGGALSTVDRVSLDGLHPRVREARIVVASDVDNPLLGPHGAAAVYGPQKGATPHQVELLDAALARWAEVVRPEAATLPGAGAAGGVGYAALAILGAQLRPGIAYLLDVLDFGKHLAEASLVG